VHRTEADVCLLGGVQVAVTLHAKGVAVEALCTDCSGTMNSFSDDVLLNGHVTLDAKGDSNAFFIIRGNLTLTLTLTVADAAQVCWPTVRRHAASSGVSVRK
jgi:hypothetical protein